MLSEISRWSGAALVAGIAPFVLVSALTTVVVFFGGERFGRETVDQPVVFNHLRHVEEFDGDCAACHPGCNEGVNSGLPPVNACALCHSTPLGESTTEAQVVALIEAGKQLEWQSLFQQPAHVFFSHRRHTTVAGLECTECHGEIGRSTAPPRHRSALRMDRCVECHEATGASADCSVCHR